MATDILFRPASSKDARVLYEIDHLCFSREIAFPMSAFKYHLRDPDSVNVVAEDASGKIVGFGIGKVYDEGEAGIITVDILSKERHKGVGTELLSKLETGLSEKNPAFFFLQVAVDNDAAISLYKKIGYQTTSVLKNYYPVKGRYRGIDALLMIKATEL